MENDDHCTIEDFMKFVKENDIPLTTPMYIECEYGIHLPCFSYGYEKDMSLEPGEESKYTRVKLSKYTIDQLLPLKIMDGG